MKGKEEILGLEHPDTLWAKYDYADILFKLNKFQEAKKLLNEIVQVGMKSPGNELSV